MYDVRRLFWCVNRTSLPFNRSCLLRSFGFEFVFVDAAGAMDKILNFEKSKEDDFYEIIGCDELSSIDQILCEYKVQSLKWHPDKNADDPDAVERFQKLQKAKEILCDPEKKALYDKWRKCGVSMPFETFLNINKAGHTSIHWVSKKNKDLMLEHSGPPDDVAPQTSAGCPGASRRASVPAQPLWERDSGSELLRKFRNYEL